MEFREREYASVWTRLGALIIDGLLLAVFYIPLTVFAIRADQYDPYEGNEVAIFIAFAIVFAGLAFWFWNTIYRMGKTGQSLGRKFLNIAVLDQSGLPIGIGRAALREIIGRWLSGMICYLGYLWAFWDDKRQMWHDKIATCYVYYVDENFS